PAEKKSDIQLKVPQSIQPAQSAGATGAAPAASPGTAVSPVAKAPAPATAAGPVTAARTPPKGRATWAWHTALSPVWLDPQEYPAGTFTPFIHGYFVHDAVVKHMPGQPYAPSLAESYEIAPDFMSATFKLRENAKFHDGSPVTSADVKFTYENYRGGNSRVLKDKTASIDTPDERTVKINFKEPFLDFLVYYGGGASAAGWVVPAKYYQEVGPDAFKQRPIGAGPFKVVRHVAGQEVEMEAFTDYWRKTPGIQTFVMKGVPEAATRSAMMQAGEADFNTLIPGQLWELVTSDPNQIPAPTRASAIFLEFPDWQKPDSPLSKRQVREAISLVLDRKAISEAEEAGLSGLVGNWIPEDAPGALKVPAPEYNPERAKQLMIEAGYPDGFEIAQFTPFPPYFSLDERVITAMRELGIRTRLNQMERAAFSQKLAEGPGALEGMLLHVSAAPGDAASWVRAWASCNGSSSRTCDPQIDDRLAAYDRSINPQERERIMNELQQYLIDQHVFPMIYRQALLNSMNSRIANQPDEIFGAVPAHPLIAPPEDVRVKE
ncbi:MAG TPA: ABC transporter substrate-binding protein, partial [Dehalococcoidia bacterium]|nr:ABC transporter substrate-binding protein [Dehalococcoidia bacterium]